MTRLHPALPLLLAGALLASCLPVSSAAAAEMPYRTPLHNDLAAAISLVCTETPCHILGVTRESVTRRIVHYTIRLRTGPEATDVIALHRVVRDLLPWRPLRSRHAIFLQHGETTGFAGTFLSGAGTPLFTTEAGLAVYLAHHRVDVWGIDQAWTLVPEGTADLSFMEGWGVRRQADDLSLGISLARAVRRIGGHRYRPMHLLAYGSGAVAGFTLLADEATQPRRQRNVKGFVPVDMTFLTDSEDLRAFMCGEARALDELHARGIHHVEPIACAMRELCSCNPAGPSPFYPGMTNHEAALYLAAGPTFGDTPIHQLAGIFDGDGIPLDLAHTPAEAWMDIMAAAAPYQPVEFLREHRHMLCGDTKPPFQGSLDRVEVPVLYLGAAGGVGVHGEHGLHFMPNAEVTTHLVQLEYPAVVGGDFGHLDLLAAANAPELAWEPLLSWIRQHR